MYDTNISEKITKAITNIIKKTKTFEKSERTRKIILGVGVICVLNFILSGINYLSLFNFFNENKKLKNICQNVQDISCCNCIKMNPNEVKERKSISVSTSTTDLNPNNIVNYEDNLYD